MRHFIILFGVLRELRVTAPVALGPLMNVGYFHWEPCQELTLVKN